MNTDAKILSKILTKRVQECIRNTIYHDQVVFIPEIQEWCNIWKSINIIHHVNKLKEKKHMIITVDTEKVFHRTQHPFMIEVLERARKETRTYLNIIKATYSSATAKIKFNGEKLKVVQLKSGTRQGSPLSISMHTVIKVLARAIWQQKDMKGKQIGKEEVKFTKKKEWKGEMQWRQFTQPGRQNLYIPADFPSKRKNTHIVFQCKRLHFGNTGCQINCKPRCEETLAGRECPAGP